MIDRIQDISILISNIQRLIISPSFNIKKYNDKDKDLYKI